MSRETGAVLLLLTTLMTAGAAAQDPERARVLRPLAAEVGPGFVWRGSVERVMRLRDELKLSESQINQLEEIRRQQVQRAQDFMELRSQMAAGQIAEEAARAQIEERNAEFRRNAEDTQSRIDGILTEEQRNLLNEKYSEIRIRAPLLRELQLDRELRLRRELPLRGRLLPGGAPLLRERGELLRRRLEGLDSTQNYYWFGSPRGEGFSGRRYQRRGVL